jgi:hypothetical protein
MSMMWIGGAATVISLATTAIGTGMSYYAQQQQAANAQAMANYNAAVMQQNAQIQAQMAQQQAIYQAEQQAAFAEAQAQAQENNAIALEQQAETAAAQGREAAARVRMENEAMLAMQRAKYAKAGLVNEGTPLIVLAEQAKLGELNAQDAIYQAELERSSLLYGAKLQRSEASYSLIAAEQARVQGQYDSAAAAVGLSMANNEAELVRLQGASDAWGYQMGANASLISGIGSMANTAMNYAYTAPSINRSTVPGGAYNQYAPVRKATPVYASIS